MPQPLTTIHHPSGRTRTVTRRQFERLWAKRRWVETPPQSDQPSKADTGTVSKSTTDPTKEVAK